jgi:cell wall-associated NlpC family hydrolase
MSMSDAISTISQIQATLTQLNAGRAPAAASAASSTTATAKTSEAFAQALTAAGAAAGAPTASLLGPAVPGNASGQAIADGARKYLGVPYVWGGTDPKTGLDCSGLVQRVYKDLGIDVPRVTYDQIKTGTAVPNIAAAKPGDLLFMRNVEHVGIYMGNNQYIHAPAPGQSVRIDAIPAGAVFDKIARIIPDAPTVPATTTATAARPDLLSTLQASLATGRAA